MLTPCCVFHREQVHAPVRRFGRRRFQQAGIALLVALSLLPAPVLARPERVTTLLAEAQVIGSFAITPDGMDVVYIADEDGDGDAELYRVPVSGGAPVKLNGPLVANGAVQFFLISADGGHVIYTADQDVDEQVELYSAPLAGGNVVKLNGSLIANGNVGPYYEIRTVGDRVLFLADQDVDELFELFSVEASGGGLVKLNQPIDRAPFSEYLVRYLPTPDGSAVIYLANQEGNGDELYRVPIAGGVSQKLSAPLPSGRRIDYHAISPDSQHVVYLVETVRLESRELYVVPVAGGSVRKLNHPLKDGLDVRFSEFTPDSRYVVYNFGKDFDSIPELYSVPIAGGAQVRLNTLGPDAVIEWFASTPDSSRVVYVGGPEANKRQLYSVPITGGPVVHLSQSPATPSVLHDLSLDPIEGRPLFRTAEYPEPNNLFLVSATGGEPAQQNYPLGRDDSVGRASFSPDGQLVIFEQGQLDHGRAVYLYAKPVDGSGARPLAGPMSLSTARTDFKIAPDSTFVVYRRRQDSTGMVALFVASLLPFEGDLHTHLLLIQQ